ncbi:MAG: DUF5702 domain-containing protein [Ruminiclostridium sp.]
MKVKNNKGTITVFISIVLSAVFLVIGTFTDAARISLAHSHVQRANKTALGSLLACYNNDLKDEYGLFGAYLDNDAIQESYEEYFSKNLNIYKDQNFLYDFKIENINIEQPINLENRDIFERQIMEYMKYRAPYEIASDLITKIDGIKNISSGSKVYKRKMETDKQASVIGQLQLSLEDKAKKINEAGITSKLASLKSDFLSQNIELDECLEKLSILQNLYSDEGNQELRKELLEDIKGVKEELSDIKHIKQEIKSNIINSVNQYKALNSEAVQNANTITTKKRDLLVRIEEELKYIKDIQDGIRELQKSYKDELSNMQKIVGEDNSADIIGRLEINVARCNSIAIKANGDEAEFLSELDKLSEARINYSFNKASPAQSDDEDNRGKVEQALKEAFTKKGESKTIDSSLLKQLPSRKAKIEEDADTKNWDNMNFDYESYADSNLDELSSKESIIEQMVSKITEELYVNEYIMGTFKHDVPLLKGENDSKAYNLRSEDKTKRDAYFSNYEVEYIINGNKDEAINSLLLKSKVLAIRLISNVIHIYTDPSKMSRITSLAAALSVWSAGLATPLIQTMLVFSWAMAESLYDIDQLTKGEKILLFKTKAQWKTDISGAVDKKKAASVENDPLCLSYQDYLKIFLIMMEKDKKLARTQDLIQLNIGVASSGFLIEDCRVMLKANTTVSMKNMFISFPLFTAESRRNISRSYISEDMCIGY